MPSADPISGGDFEDGLIKGDALLLFPWRNLASWKFIKLLAAGDCPIHPFPGLAEGIAPNGVLNLLTWGVVRRESSMSSASIKSTSELLSSESEPIMFTLPSELEAVILSAFDKVDHSECELLFVSVIPEK
jgi:hypothetical protein